MTPPYDPLSGALARVGDRWSLLIVDALMAEPRRFGDLQSALPGIATNVLAQRLRQLESDHVLIAQPYSRRPLRYSYGLTEAGRDLAGAARLLAEWGAQWGGGHSGGRPAAPAHEACGTALVTRYWCPTCEMAVDAETEPVIWV
jgi:DNA-binding HxlR family transcriptional regulator